MEFFDVIKSRTSTRKFSNRTVSDDILKKILEAGRLAPSAKNLQPQKIFVIRSDNGLKKIDNSCPCRYNAPICLLVCSNKDVAWRKNDYSSYEMDASIVATHMILAATDLGLDSTWIRNFESNKLIEEFNIDDNIVPVCIINLGYKSDDCPNNPLHEIRKEINEIVEYI